MNSYLIALGSNMGDRLAMLRAAVGSLAQEVGPVERRSSFYATEPVGAATLEFINAALVLTSHMPPRDVMRALLRVEKKHGRTRDVPGGDRTLDCDLILCRTTLGTYPVVDEPELILPHPRALERAFVLVPAAEVAPDWRHPVSGRTLVEECTARSFQLTPQSSWRIG